MNNKKIRDFEKRLDNNSAKVTLDFLASENFERIIEKKCNPKVIKKYTDYFKENINNAIGKYEDIVDGIAYRYVFFYTVEGTYILYTSRLMWDLEKYGRINRWTVLEI